MLEPRLEPLDRVEGEWRGLLESQGACRRPFFHPSWARAWLETLGEGADPAVITLREGERLVAVVPLMRAGDGSLQFLGDHNVSDYMDISCTAGLETEALGALLRWPEALAAGRIELWGVPDGSGSEACIERVAGDAGWRAEREVEALCPVVELPDTWEDYLGSLSKKDRHELRRKLRRLFESDRRVEVETLSTAGEILPALSEFIHLLVTSRGDKARFMTPQVESFFRRFVELMAPEGCLRLQFLTVDGKRVASVLGFETEGEVLLYNSGYDPAYSDLSVGLLSKALYLKDAIERGKRRFNFLRGAEPYKYDLGGKDSPVYRFTLTRPPA